MSLIFHPPILLRSCSCLTTPLSHPLHFLLSVLPLATTKIFGFFLFLQRKRSNLFFTSRRSGCSSLVEWGLDKLLFHTHTLWSWLNRVRYIGNELFTYSRILGGRVWINPPLRFSYLSFSARLFDCVWFWICSREIETVLTLCEGNFATSRGLKEKEIGRRVVKKHFKSVYVAGLRTQT